ncbi:MAG: LPS export ABC transporter periplasmic protein LptC [Candidatus Omnitrophica bacterium]|nr:LPS export ABC transporter periplasmic protein LptC [Candidatus Omnitrophota bacterium]MBI2173630.1 LPS export ABC transporter periplasmic protein LptC [Candidatus Omnitrophota bacterium]MBI3009705.1 LPS export ABC transporter periplasmic protein LptC [Candidatus Omnitrophota bacterium]
MKHPIRRRILYLSFQGLRTLVGCLPLSLARALGFLLGSGAYIFLASQRRLTLSHLKFALGSSFTDKQYRRIARDVFCNLGQTAMEWLLLPRLSGKDLKQLIRCEGMEHLRQALSKSEGAVALSAHFGNWELIALYLSVMGFKGAILARRLRYPEYESFLIGMRGQKGVATLARGSLKEVATLLRAKQIVGIMADQDVESLEGIFVDFFGHPAYTPVGPAALSVMTGAPIVPCFLIRERNHFRLIIEPALQAPQGVNRSQALLQLTQAWSGVVESYIRRYPSQWVWMHRRWKTKPPSLTDAPVANFVLPPKPSQPGLSLACGIFSILLVLGGITGCDWAKPSSKALKSESSTAAESSQQDTTQQMSTFNLAGYEESGQKRWELEGQGASIDGQIVTILQPDAISYDPSRTAYMTASVALFNQQNRKVRLEHEVTIHTSDGLWFTSPVLHWLPDEHQVITEEPVRIETDHMLLRGRGAEGFTELKQGTIARDIEMVLNPSDEEPAGTGRRQVTITCDGPLSFDYQNDIATFENNVHVQDPNGDLYSDKLVAYLNQESHTIRYAEATGRVRIHQNQNTALSERAVYEPGAGKITLVGKPSLLIYPSESSPESLSLSGLETAQR